MITTEAWVLSQGVRQQQGEALAPGQLERRQISISEPENDEVLVEPLWGCWEANMTHALDRAPADVCRLRMEEFVVLGNAGVVRVLKPGPGAAEFKEGDRCILVPIGKTDQYGNLVTVLGYDAPKMHGLLAKRIKLLSRQILKIPEGSPHTLEQWAAFSLRYSTAWVNFHLSFGTYRLIASERQVPEPWVIGWGGGVAFAQLQLAQRFGCRVALIASGTERLASVAKANIPTIDRSTWGKLDFDEARYNRERAYKSEYLRAEGKFVRTIRDVTDGQGAAIFIDNIGRPVFRATLKALRPQAVVTTCGWKFGQDISFRRAVACMLRQQLVHSHGASYEQGVAGVLYAEAHGWVPDRPGYVYDWNRVPDLANDYAAGRISSYFPMYRVNPL